ncbi:MAG: hypothetical protein JRJ05_03195, partial [Deltaproteobacteria bacterium]|nr:hypothetical protein [Deltaproteobacteria bacterium]
MMKSLPRTVLALVAGVVAALAASAEPGGIGSRVFVVERASESLAVYDFVARKLLP